MRILLVAFAILFSTAIVTAQDGMTPKEIKKMMKEWKKKKKRMSPEEFKELVESNEKMKSQISQMTVEMEDLRLQVQDQQDEIKDLKDENKRLKGQIAQLREENAKPKGIPGFAVGNPNEGIVFKVQIGAFRNKDLSKYIDNNPHFSGEEGEDGSKKYSIGIFRDYWEADAFKKYMREMGVKDAWIVSYKDGARVDIKDVLEGVVNED
jgi:TolA-binding protein